MTQSRRSNIQQHRARPADPARTAHTNRPEENEEEKITYIDFINKLLHKMRMDSIKRMLDTALDEID